MKRTERFYKVKNNYFERKLVYMKARLVFSLLPVCILLHAKPLVNHDFETGLLTPWRSPQQSYGTVTLFRPVKSDTGGNGTFYLESRGDKQNKYNQFITLVQDIEVVLSSDAFYCFGGYARANVKSSSGKHAKFAIREVNAEGITVMYQDILVNLDDPTGRSYEKTFSPSLETKTLQFYLILSGLEADDVVIWDNIFFFGDEQSASFDARRTKSTSAKLELKNDEISAFIDAESGLLDSLRFGNITIHPSALDNSIVFVRFNGQDVIFKNGKNKPVFFGNTIKTELFPEDQAVPFKGIAEYSIDSGFFTEKIVFTALEAVHFPVKIGIRHGVDMEQWDKIICALYPARALDARESTIFSYSEKNNDRNIGLLDTYQHPVYPMTMLKSPSGILLAGSFNLDKFVTVSPNMPQGYFPSLQKNPLSVSKGEKFEFVYSCRFYSADKFWVRDVWRDYAKRIYSNNPMIKDFIPYKDRPYRPYFRGAHVGSTFFMESREKRLPPESNIWWFGWLDWLNETYPVEGEWWTNAIHGKWHKVTAEKMQAEIARLQRAGHKLALYCRQLANLNLKGSKFPESWYRVKAGGSLDLYGGGYRVQISPEMQEEHGFPDIPWGTYDFDNPEFNEHYVQQIKAAVAFYEPKAIGWDMGWRPDHPGMFAAQAQIFHWMRKEYPQNKVITNESGAGPELFVADLALLENGALAGKNEYDFEFIKAFGNPMVCIERVGLFQDAVRLNLSDGKSSWLSADGLHKNKQYLLYLLKKHPDLSNDHRELARLCQLRMCLWDQGLGAAPGYLNELEKYPAPILTMAQDTVSIPLITESFVLRFSNNQDRMNPLFASAWLDETMARMVIFNDSDESQEFSLKMQKKYFLRHNWNKTQLADGEIFMVDPQKSLPTQVTWSENEQDIIFSGKLPPYTAYMSFKDKPKKTIDFSP